MGLRPCPIPDPSTQHIRAQLSVLMDEAGGDVAALLALIGQDPDEWVEVETRWPMVRTADTNGEEER